MSICFFLVYGDRVFGVFLVELGRGCFGFLFLCFGWLEFSFVGFYFFELFCRGINIEFY